MNALPQPYSKRALRALERAIQRQHRRIQLLKGQRDLMATVFHIQARDERGRFLPFLKGVK